MFRTRTLILALAIGVAAPAFACSLLTSLDGLSTGPAADDSGVDAPADASTDAPTSAGEAGASDADAGDAGRFCDRLSPPAQLCDDFDDVGPFTKWTLVGVPSPTATRDTTDVRSPPNALLVTTPGGATPQSSVLRYVVPAAVGKLHVAYDMRIDTHGAYAEVGYVRVINSSTLADVYYLHVGTSGSPVAFSAEAHLSDGGIPGNHNVDLAGAPLFDAWTHVNLDIDLASPTRTATVHVDGAVAAVVTLEPLLFSTGTTEVDLGIDYTSYGSGAWGVRYDNATVDWE